MRIKVCGITFQEQFDKLVELGIDMVGLNFYKKSKRYLESDLIVSNRYQTKVTGVFVNEPLVSLKSIASKFKLDYLQLHGDEDITYCQSACRFSSLIKVIKVKDDIDLNIFKKYNPYVDYFLLDTFTEQYGGSGKTFDWELLSNIQTKKKLIISGGIGMEHVSKLIELKNDRIWGIDVNSKFEIGPGIKDLNKIIELKKALAE